MTKAKLISKETLNAVNVGILTDEQLNEALIHYSNLEQMLSCHGELYQLCRQDVNAKLLRLKGFKEARNGLD